MPAVVHVIAASQQSGLDDAPGVGAYFLENNLVHRNAADFQEIVDQPRDVVDLSVHNILSHVNLFASDVGHLQEGESAGDCGQGVSQLVAEHGDKFVFAAGSGLQLAVGGFQVGGPLSDALFQLGIEATNLGFGRFLFGQIGDRRAVDRLVTDRAPRRQDLCLDRSFGRSQSQFARHRAFAHAATADMVQPVCRDRHRRQTH